MTPQQANSLADSGSKLLSVFQNQKLPLSASLADPEHYCEGFEQCIRAKQMFKTSSEWTQTRGWSCYSPMQPWLEMKQKFLNSFPTNPWPTYLNPSFWGAQERGEWLSGSFAVKERGDQQGAQVGLWQTPFQQLQTQPPVRPMWAAQGRCPTSGRHCAF